MVLIKGKTQNEIKLEFRTFIQDNFLFGEDSSHINDADSFMDSGVIDSTGILELIEFIEQNSSIKIKDEDLLPENLDSLNNISSFVINKLSLN